MLTLPNCGLTGYDEKMELTVAGVEAGQEQYRFLWGFYVRGFKPWEHCQKCFRGTRALGISPAMGNGSVNLLRPTDYFYLCGYAKGPASNRGIFNLHLAVEPAAGESASISSKYGPVFTISDARRILIPETNEPKATYGQFDYRCMNFRFARVVYPTACVGPSATRSPILKSS